MTVAIRGHSAALRQVGHPCKASRSPLPNMGDARADARCSIRGHQHPNKPATSHHNKPSQQAITTSHQNAITRSHHSNALTATPSSGKAATHATPVSMSCLTSRSINETGSITHSGPMTFTLPGVSRPDGHRWNAYLCPSSLKTVCPAFSPELTRATTFEGSVACDHGSSWVIRGSSGGVIKAHHEVIRGSYCSSWLIRGHQGSSP